MENKGNTGNYGWKALIPILVFLGLYLGCGTYFTIQGAESPFWIMPRYVALMIGILVALICFDRKEKLSAKVDIYCKGAGAPGVMLLGIIVLLAGGFANATAAIGGKESMVNLGIHLIPTQFLIPGIFLICCIISTCIGTSMGTQVTMIPVAVALAQGAGLNVGMAGAAAIAGAYFGDNLSMISDTTIIATKGVGAEIKDKFIMNFKIAIPAAVITMVLYGVMSLKDAASVQSAEAGSYNVLTIVPYFVVIILAIAGLDVVLALVTGTAIACVIGLLSMAISGTTLNNPVACLISAPIAKEIGEEYKIAPKRMASLLDIFSCAILMVVPHDSGCLLVQQYGGCSYLDIIKYAFYPVLLIAFTCATIQFNLMTTKEEKAVITAETKSSK